MRIKGIKDLNQVFGFEVYQDQKQPREKKLTERGREPTFSTHKWRLLPLCWKTISLNRCSNRLLSSSPILQFFHSAVTGYFLNMVEKMSFQ